MSRKLLLCAAVSCVFSAPAVHASPVLIAIGSLPSDISDQSTATAGLLESGVAGNLLGGIGSGLAWAGGNTFIAVPDRGPNASTYNPLVDNTTSYIDRFQTVQMTLTATPGATLPFALTPTLNYGSGALGTDATHTLGTGVPALNAINKTNYFTGRSDGFSGSGSGNPAN